MSLVFPDIIILAGGFGTRLQSVVKDVPKPMAPVAEKPFLYWLLNYLKAFNPNKIILSTGYKHEVIEEYFGDSFHNIPLEYSIEKESLGTGGAIKKAFDLLETDNTLVLNGDTFFRQNHLDFLNFHLKEKSLFSMALKQMNNPYRYGTVEVQNSKIVHFHEKDLTLKDGLINTGVYLMSKQLVDYLPEADCFSFEKDFMEINAKEIEMKGYITDNYFIDIGIPEDYNKANDEFPKLFN
jgi:D-glycero-alpha-D-manno-heptose 1-phosphate guanylyltransferase